MGKMQGWSDTDESGRSAAKPKFDKKSFEQEHSKKTRRGKNTKPSKKAKHRGVETPTDSDESEGENHATSRRLSDREREAKKAFDRMKNRMNSENMMIL